MVKPVLTAFLAVALVGAVNPIASQQRDGTAQADQRHAPPERPRAIVDLPPETTTGRTIHVKAGESLQTAIDSAAPGDRITLDARATYEGPFRLPAKEGNGWIVIASAAERQLPARGERVAPADAAHMPRLVASSGAAVLIAMPGAHHYRFVGLELSPASGEYLNAIVQLGDSETSADAQPHHIVIERS